MTGSERERAPSRDLVGAAGLLRWLSLSALIIVLDQFPRNLFRQSPRAFATDAAALTTGDGTGSTASSAAPSAEARATRAARAQTAQIETEHLVEI